MPPKPMKPMKSSPFFVTSMETRETSISATTLAS